MAYLQILSESILFISHQSFFHLILSHYLLVTMANQAELTTTKAFADKDCVPGPLP